MSVSSRYFLASIALLVVLVAVHAASSARRTQVELREHMEQRGLALAGAVETGSRHAIRSNALLEEMIARRLLDNARLVDELLRWPAFSIEELRGVATRNGLSRIDLIDRDGRPWTPPPPPAGGHRMMMGMGPHHHEGRPMMPFMWGHRWGRADRAPGGDTPPAIAEGKFWEGTVFGVAVGARSFPGVIAVHADAAAVLNFRGEIGVERQIEEIAREAGVTAMALVGPDLTVLAHSQRARVGTRIEDGVLAEAVRTQRGFSRLTAAGAGPGAGTPDAGRAEAFQVVRPIRLDGDRPGLLLVDFPTESMHRAWRRDLRSGLLLGGVVLLAGAVGMAGIFYVQQRSLREMNALQAEMARRERLAALGDVAAAFAHEVRNPLNAVALGLQRLRLEFAPEPADEYARLVDVMQGEARRLNATVEQFIALARPLPVTPAPMDAAALAREVAALVEPEAREAGVEVRVAAPATLSVVADHDHLKQVLLNLALNGVQAMREGGGTLSIEAGAGRAGVALTVTDTGPGVAADVLPRIFDPYFTTRRGGLGLGLTIARRIVDAHGGRLEAENVPGGGARFRVHVPSRPGARRGANRRT